MSSFLSPCNANRAGCVNSITSKTVWSKPFVRSSVCHCSTNPGSVLNSVIVKIPLSEWQVRLPGAQVPFYPLFLCWRARCHALILRWLVSRHARFQDLTFVFGHLFPRFCV